VFSGVVTPAKMKNETMRLGVGTCRCSHRFKNLQMVGQTLSPEYRIVDARLVYDTSFKLCFHKQYCWNKRERKEKKKKKGERLDRMPERRVWPPLNSQRENTWYARVCNPEDIILQTDGQNTRESVRTQLTVDLRMEIYYYRVLGTCVAGKDARRRVQTFDLMLR